jgi:hypothetical protein
MFWGIVSVLVGSLLGYLTVRNLFFFNLRIANRDAVWFTASLVPMSALVVYFVWLGKNQLQRAGGQEAKKPRFRWGRLLLGSCIVFFALEGHFASGPDALKADNESEALGMLLAFVVMLSVGVLLMALTFRPPKQKPSREALPAPDKS